MKQVSMRLALFGLACFYVGIALFLVDWFVRPAFVIPFLTVGGLTVFALAVFLQGSEKKRAASFE
ncbi:hypothetical protein LF817_16340 [Halobacillus sp. A1]|uniref:hypothetical protein n=1 Tax=Halobacillus sp. A1 TaxID=2880262 RepID=UPI0020A6CD1D|nr:hypothetical protein [Halobacillus sp. A1]MCP3032895.1 hypothetical protein [Halobacillus sp. A1]